MWVEVKFSNLGLALGMDLKYYSRVTKGLKLRANSTFVEVTGEKLVGEPFLLTPTPSPPILNRVDIFGNSFYFVLQNGFCVFIA